MQTKSTAATTIASRNESWGFDGAVRSNLNLNDADVAALFDRAARFTAEHLTISLDAARRFLDGKLGRHLADQCDDAALIEKKLGELYASWTRDVREFRKTVINTTDEDFYA